MSIKAGVRLHGVRPEIAFVVAIVRGVFEARNVPFVVTSVTEGVHSRGSLHYQGAALDVRLAPRAEDNGPILDLLRASLGDDFDVVLEANHFHIEYQPKEAYGP